MPTWNEYMNNAMRGVKLNEEADTVDKSIAAKMKMKGYKFVMIFPKEYDLPPFYIKSMQQGRELMRKEFRNMKNIELMTVNKWLGEKEEENEV